MHLEKHAEPALLLEAFSKIVIALTLFTVWVFVGPFAFALMMSFGVLALGMFTNWIIVLYALTAEEHGSNE